nr:MFS transporter [Mycobacterium spongiae]
MGKTRTTRRRALRSPQSGNFRLFMTSHVTSQFGQWLQLVALAWMAAEMTGSGSTLGWIAVAAFGPLLILGPWTGALADRMDKLRLLRTMQLLIVGQAAALGAVVLTATTTMTVVFGLTLAYGMLYAVETPTRRALLAELVDHDQLPRAVSISHVVSAVGRILGPVSAGALIASVGIGWCFITTAVSYVVALSALHAIRRDAMHAAEPAQETGAVRAGLRYVWRIPELRIALLLTAILTTFGFNQQVVIPLLVEQDFGGDVVVYTLLYTALSVGSVFGAVAAARRREIDLRLLTAAIIAFGVANGLIAISPNLMMALAASVATGTTAFLFVTSATVLLQQRCAPTMRGRVMALHAMVFAGGLPIGGPIMGAIADYGGPRAAMAVGSVAALLGGAAVLRHILAHHTVPDEYPQNLVPART